MEYYICYLRNLSKLNEAFNALGPNYLFMRGRYIPRIENERKFTEMIETAIPVLLFVARNWTDASLHS